MPRSISFLEEKVKPIIEGAEKENVN